MQSVSDLAPPKSGVGNAALVRPKSLIIVVVLLTLFVPHVHGQVPEGAEVPWPLRDHLTFSKDGVALLYDVETADWRFEVEGVGPLLNNVGFEVVYADGAVLTSADFEKATLTREQWRKGSDEGNLFTSEFPPKNGFAVRYGVLAHKAEPFLEFRMTLRNVGSAPIEIAALRPVVVGPECMQPLSAATGLITWPIKARAGSFVFTKEAGAALSMFHDPLEKACLALGVLPEGMTGSGATFRLSGGRWQGSITCGFNPAVRLGPGAALDADPLWVSYCVPNPSEVCQYYAWACAGLPGLKPAAEPPHCWVTIGDSAPVSALYEAARLWADAGVRHALVPGTWEGRPGSLEGAVPRYPKDMKKVAAELRALNMTPGLTIDPLAVKGGSGAWTALSADGQRWLDVSSPKARAYGSERIATILAWGFEFLVIEPGAIPDEVLRHFGMTRTQAYHYAFEMVQDAAGGVPVLPASAATLRADLAAWLEAAAGTSMLRMYQAGVGPVRFDATDVAALPEEFVMGLRLFGGPIELVGKPRKAALQSLTSVFTLPRLAAYPLDVTVPDCRLWRAWAPGNDEGRVGDRVVVFPGALAWGPDDLRLDKGDAWRVWRARDGAFVDPDTESFQAADRLRAYGLMPVLSRPALMGASVGAGTILDDITHLKWSEPVKGKGVLSGLFGGGHAEEATAFVDIPEGWAFRSGKVGAVALSRRGVIRRLQFDVPPGQATRFELQFKRGKPGEEPAELEPTEQPAAETPARESGRQTSGQTNGEEPSTEAEEPGPKPGKRVWRGLKGAAGKLF